MSTLFARILELEKAVEKWRHRCRDLERSRDMWKSRALRYGRGH